ncbi:NnrU protein [Aliidongia dinghuensis]|uniref:NnrU protein n=1 Tax=Aliidongia dinghuensis TaxID=1867774 RepID=A0A8J2Z0U9_9PROT|nr:NnrU family protein [Aliidongia dinghuensis]GGF48764.1 NnrU protein [Aliidongia dinghuensis]
MAMLIIAAVAFVGTHFLLSHPLRAGVVHAIGEQGFTALYSVVAFATLGWMVAAYLAAPTTEPHWVAGDLTWAIATAVMLLASILLAGSLVKNPAFPTLGAPLSEPGPARGVYAITRHPMMWSFAIWGLAHIAVYPVDKNIAVAIAIVVLALVGSRLQDAKKERAQPDVWPAWERRTSFIPFAAVIAGRAQIGSLGPFATIAGTLLWLGTTWAHLPLAGWAAGIWRWM